MAWEWVFYVTPAGRAPAEDDLKGITARFRAQIVADIDAVARYEHRAPASVKNLGDGLSEIRTGNYRTFFCVHDHRMWILHVCKKEHQERGIAAARRRLRDVKQ